MLKVKTKLGVSTIAGIGLFADQFIPKDTIIWEFNPPFDSKWHASIIENASEDEKLQTEFLKTYCFKFNGAYILCVDNARFFNHSNTPNCYSSDFSEKALGYTRALRDIRPGEELTDDYSAFGISEDDKSFNLDIF